MYRLTELPRPPPQSGRSSSSAYRAAHTTSKRDALGLAHELLDELEHRRLAPPGDPRAPGRPVPGWRTRAGARAGPSGSRRRGSASRRGPRRRCPSAMHSRSTICFASSGGVHSTTISSSRARSASGGACAASPISCRRICASGPNVTSSSNGLARPISTFVSSGRPATNSSATRLLPDPRLAEQRHQVAAPRLARAVERVLQQSELALAVRRTGSSGDPSPAAARRPATRAPRPRTPSPRPRASARTGPATARGGSSSRRRARSRGRPPAAAAPPCSRWRRRAGPARTPRCRSRPDPCGCPTRTRSGTGSPISSPEAPDAVDEREPGADRAERVVVVRVLEAEDPDDRVPGEVVRRGRGATRAPRPPSGSTRVRTSR